MPDLSGGNAFVDVMPSMRGYFQQMRREIRNNPVEHEVEPFVDRRKLDQARQQLEQASEKASAARRKEADATGAVAVAEAKLQALMDKGVTDAGRLAAATEAVAKAKRSAEDASKKLAAAEEGQRAAQNRAARVEARFDDAEAESEARSWFSRIATRSQQAGDDAAGGFVSAFAGGLGGLASRAAPAMGGVVDRMSSISGGGGMRSAGEFADGFADGVSGLASKTGPIAGTVLGVVALFAGAGALIVNAIQDGLSAELSRDTFQAQTGISEAQARKFGLAAGESYADAFGESVESNLNTVKVAMQSGLLDPAATQRDAELMINSLSGVSDLIGDDIPAVARAAGQALKTGFAQNAQDAFDLIVKGAQIGLNASEDWLDTITEYGTQFRKLGLTGADSIGLMSQALRGGARDTDLAADALKEFSIRAVDGSESSAEGFALVGLNASDMTAKISAGGEGAREGLRQVLDGLRGIEDPAVRAQAAVALFGTQAEDLGAALYAMDLNTATKSLNDYEGAAKRAIDVMGGNAATSVEGAMRSIEVASNGLKAALAEAFGPYIKEFADSVSNNRAGVIQFFIDVGNRVFDAGEAVLRFAANGMRGLGDFTRSAANAGAGVLDMAANILHVTDIIPGLGTALDIMGGVSAGSLRDMADSTRELGNQLGSSLNTGADAIEQKLIPGLDHAQSRFNQFAGEMKISAAFNDEIAKVTSAISNLGVQADGSLLKIEKWTGSLDRTVPAQAELAKQLGGLSAKFLEQNRAGIEAGATVEELTQQYLGNRDALIQQVMQMGLTNEQALTLVNSFGLVPELVQTQINTPGMPKALTDLDLLRGLVTTDNEKNVIVKDTSPETMDKLHRLNLMVMDNKVVPVDADDQRAKNVLQAFLNQPAEKSVTVALKFRQDQIDYWRSLGVANPEVVQGPTPWRPRMFGGIDLERYANGGTRLPSLATIKPETPSLVQWAEPGTGGEAFIPLAPGKRGRSTQILSQVAGMFGYDLVPMADGGILGGGRGASSVGPLLVDVLRKLTSALTSGAASAAAPAGATATVGINGAALDPTGVTALGETVQAATTTQITPALAQMQTQLRATSDLTATVTSGQMIPAWNALGLGVTAVTAGSLEPAFAGIQTQLAATAQITTATTYGTVLPTWTAMGAGIDGVKTGTIDPAFAGIQGGLNTVQGAFATGVGAISAQWDQMRGAVGRPVRFAIDTVFNDGLVGMWNSVSDLLGTQRMNPYVVGGFAKGTSVLPGYSPGVDNMQFVSRDGSTAINLGGGEGIARPEVVRGMGRGYFDALNRAAATGGVGGVQRVLGNFALGGVIDRSLWNAVKTAFPAATLNSAYRPGHSGYHGKAQAIDVGGPMQQIANWAFRTMPGLAQLIYGPGPLIAEGNTNQAYARNYFRDDIAGHFDHVHMASRVPVNNLGQLVSMEGANLSGAEAFSMADYVKSMTDEARGRTKSALAGVSAPGIIGTLPQKLFDSMSTAMDQKLTELAEAFSADPGGAGVERWRPLAMKALGWAGYTPPEAYIENMMKQIATESGGDPNIVQGVQDVNSGGNEAVGLLQVTRTTFDAYRDPRLPNDRRDPFANMVAGLNWVTARYNRDLNGVWGKGHGYDSGGIAAGTGFMLKKVIRPERVLDPNMTRSFDEKLIPILDRLTGASVDDVLTSSDRNAVVSVDLSGTQVIGQQIERQYVVDDKATARTVRRDTKRAMAETGLS